MLFPRGPPPLVLYGTGWRNVVAFGVPPPAPTCRPSARNRHPPPRRRSHPPARPPARPPPATAGVRRVAEAAGRWPPLPLPAGARPRPPAAEGACPPRARSRLARGRARAAGGRPRRCTPDHGRPAGTDGTTRNGRPRGRRRAATATAGGGTPRLPAAASVGRGNGTRGHARRRPAAASTWPRRRAGGQGARRQERFELPVNENRGSTPVGPPSGRRGRTAAAGLQRKPRHAVARGWRVDGHAAPAARGRTQGRRAATGGADRHPAASAATAAGERRRGDGEPTPSGRLALSPTQRRTRSTPARRASAPPSEKGGGVRRAKTRPSLTPGMGHWHKNRRHRPRRLPPPTAGAPTASARRPTRGDARTGCVQTGGHWRGRAVVERAASERRPTAAGRPAGRPPPHGAAAAAAASPPRRRRRRARTPPARAAAACPSRRDGV
ncbi:hypothetical protein BU14_0891s0002 [Porphyra umbilicalis]|uniref:Uncharacterized protein n=1 Tax=Porphyra umbilicalis TaxID=2786 RepID=A0A1X6NNG1_PORUM|nr:hypothetical protein BU14_0891s0002 [Porphyra umbilicalis]|eukprot:OSX70127.1 hypothetical protein BU14_0891s0002 [Porphyra umbilicalis]